MDDSYMKEFDATVTRVEGNKVFLDRTAFYPRGGGLVSDTGEIDGVRVVEVVKEDGDVAHILKENPFRQGQAVHGKIDWDRRYRVMRMHTTAHILSSIFHSETGALITGNQISPDRSRIDFSIEEFDKEFFIGLIEKANRLVSEGAEVKVYYMPREEALKIPGMVKLAGRLPPSVEKLRIVEIEGIDIQADGGPHVKNIREIGKIVFLKAENKGKTNRRLYFTVEP